MSAGSRLIPVAVVFVALLAAVVSVSAQRSAIEEGRRAFTAAGCYGCHTIEKFGTPIGPDLSRVGARHDAEYLTRWLRDPSAQRPNAHMPVLELSVAQVEALAAFLSSLR